MSNAKASKYVEIEVVQTKVEHPMVQLNITERQSAVLLALVGLCAGGALDIGDVWRALQSVHPEYKNNNVSVIDYVLQKYNLNVSVEATSIWDGKK